MIAITPRRDSYHCPTRLKSGRMFICSNLLAPLTLSHLSSRSVENALFLGQCCVRSSQPFNLGRLDVLPAGQRLRALREELGLTIRDVEAASERVAARHGNEDFAITPSRLSDIETKGILPNIYRLYSLAVIYRRDLHQLLEWYGIDLSETAADLGLSQPPRSHLSGALDSVTSLQVPVRLDPAFDPRRTANLGRLIERWGLVPMAYLYQFSNTKYIYGYIGGEDLTMYPLLPPGSFVQVDPAVNSLVEGHWRSEYERPIYFLELRDGYTASWCSLKGECLILQPHPLSPAPVRMLKRSYEVEILGRVVGIAMRLEGLLLPLVEPQLVEKRQKSSDD